MPPTLVRDILEAGDDSKQTTSLRHPDVTTSASALSDLQPWTAARCQRLLRQLQSRLEALRKLHFKGCVETAERAKRPAPAQDSAEGPRQARKKVRYTYGNRHACVTNPSKSAPSKSAATTPPRSTRMMGTLKASHESPTASQVVVPTPLWRKMRNQHTSELFMSEENELSIPADNMTSLPARLVEQLRVLQYSVPSAQYRIYEAIFHWLTGLLRSTTPKPEDTSRKSLLGMCLRKVPACVADIEMWERQQAKKRGNGSTWTSSSASAGIYSQLEAFGSKSVGWRPLKIVVLSHAIESLSTATREGVIETRFACLLGRLCKHWGRTEEASMLMSSASDALPLTLHTTRDDVALAGSQWQALRGTIDWMTREPNPGCFFDCLTRLMKEKRLPAAWFSTQGFKQSWLRALEVLTAGSGGPSALGFMCATMEFLSKRGDGETSADKRDRQQMLVNVVSVVVAAILTIDSGASMGTIKETSRGQGRLLLVLEKSVRQFYTQERRRGPRNGALFTLILARQLALVENANSMLQTLQKQATNELGTIVAKAGAQTQALYDQAVMLACAVAQCRRRTRAMAGHDAVAEVCSRMDDISLHGLAGNTLRSDVAFLLAQKTKDLRDLAHAESLAAVTETQATSTNTVFSGWRWEEGISEWVLLDPSESAATPDGMGSGPRHASPTLLSGGKTATRTHQPVAPVAVAAQARTRIKGCPSGQARAVTTRGRQSHTVRGTVSHRAGCKSVILRPDDDEKHDEISTTAIGTGSTTISSNNTRRPMACKNTVGTKSSGKTVVAWASSNDRRACVAALGDGKENEFGNASRRSISDKATDKVYARGIDQQRHESNRTKGRVTLSRLSQGLTADTDWDELM